MVWTDNGLLKTQYMSAYCMQGVHFANKITYEISINTIYFKWSPLYWTPEEQSPQENLYECFFKLQSQSLEGGGVKIRFMFNNRNILIARV